MAILGRHHDVRVRKEIDEDADDAVAPRVPRPRLLAVARDERLGEGTVVGVEVPVGDVKERRVGWGHRWRRGVRKCGVQNFKFSFVCWFICKMIVVVHFSLAHYS